MKKQKNTGHFGPWKNHTFPKCPVTWAKSDIDRFIQNQLQDHGLTPNPQAGPRELVRRASYDLTGLPPEPEVVEAFAADPSPQAWAALIDELLESPHYGEQWGRHWLDLVRYAETNSYERDGAKPFVWRYRDYVIQSFNADKPYDQFITEQLAGDELPNRTPDSIIATGYYRLGRWDDEPADPELAYYDDLDDIVTTTGQSLLGLSINCARCHDHKIDPIPQTDYYSMIAFFRGVKRYGTRSHESVLEASVTEIPQPEESSLHDAAMAQYERELRNIENDLAKIEEKAKKDFTGVDNDEFAYEENRVLLIERRKGGLLTDKEVNNYRNLTNRRDKLRENRPTGMAQALCVKEDVADMKPTCLLMRGNPQSPGEEVQPSFPSVLSPPQPEILPLAEGAVSSGRRTALAKWMTSPDESADVPSDGESSVAISFWSRHCANVERFWLSGKQADASGIARLAGFDVCRIRLVHQSHASADHEFRGVSDEFRRSRRRTRQRRHQRSFLAIRYATTFGRRSSRFHSLGQRDVKRRPHVRSVDLHRNSGGSQSRTVTARFRLGQIFARR